MEFFELIRPYGAACIIILSISTFCFAILEYLSKRVIHAQDELIKSQDRLIEILQKELYKELATNANKTKPHKID